jgi:hypothetical protein
MLYEIPVTTGSIDGVRATQDYLVAVLCEPELQMAPLLVDFFSGAETPPRPGGEESFQVGLAGAVLVICHHPPKKDMLQVNHSPSSDDACATVKHMHPVAQSAV